MELFESLGINGKLLIAQIINFLILMYVLKRFAYAPIINILEQRKATIDKGLKDSAEAANKLAKIEEDVKAIREEAYTEAKKIAADAKAQAEVSAKEIIDKANEQAARTLKFAEQEAGLAKDKALAEARSHIASIVTLALEKIVGSELNREQRDSLTAKAIKEL